MKLFVWGKDGGILLSINKYGIFLYVCLMFIPKCHHLQVKASDTPFLRHILNAGSKSKTFQQLDINES